MLIIHKSRNTFPSTYNSTSNFKHTHTQVARPLIPLHHHPFQDLASAYPSIHPTETPKAKKTNTNIRGYTLSTSFPPQPNFVIIIANEDPTSRQSKEECR